MDYISYLVITGLSLVGSPFVVPSEPIVLEEEKVEIVLEEKIEEEIVCSCILTARAHGVDIPYNTNASDLEPNGMLQVGGLVLLRYGEIDHVAVIVSLDGDIYDGNYNNPPNGCREGYRKISWGDKEVRGFWSPEENDTVDKLVLRL